MENSAGPQVEIARGEGEALGREPAPQMRGIAIGIPDELARRVESAGNDQRVRCGLGRGHAGGRLWRRLRVRQWIGAAGGALQSDDGRVAVERTFPQKLFSN